jgi:uncharacterized membrane protein
MDTRTGRLGRIRHACCSNRGRRAPWALCAGTGRRARLTGVADRHDDSQGHGHGHDHDHPRHEVAGDVRRTLVVTTAVLLGAALVGVAVFWPRDSLTLDRESLGFSDRVQATVTRSETGPCAEQAADQCLTVTARVDSGDNAGDTATIETVIGGPTQLQELEEGDAIVLNDAGSDLPAEARYSFADMQRATPLVVLALLFAAVVVALGRLKGLLALAGIVLSMGVLLVYMFPALLSGSSPVGVALSGCAVIAFGTLYLAHGVSDRTTVALLGTLASLALTAILATGFAAAAELTGLASEESLTLLTFAPDIDFRGLLLAAVILGALGVLDDVTITQVSAVWELRRTDPTLSRRQLYAAGIRIGRDHIASTVNTLVLAYSAAALPLLLIYTQSGLGFGGVLTTETVAVEIVQTLVGSIGLVASVPLTTALACHVITRRARPAAPDRAGVRAGPGEDEAPWWGADTWAPPRGTPAPTAPAAPPTPPGRTDRRARRRSDDDEFWTNDPW